MEMKKVTENVLEAEWTRLVLDEPRVDARFVELMTTIENSQFLQKTNTSLKMESVAWIWFHGCCSLDWKVGISHDFDEMNV